jgi:hypothetical protein
MMRANRNGFFTPSTDQRESDPGEAVVRVTWAKEFDANGRPILLPGNMPDEKGSLTCPDITGGTNFYPPSYDPAQRLFFVTAREVCATYYSWKPEFTQGDRFTGGAAQRARGSEYRPTARFARSIRRPAIAAVRCRPGSAILTTASGLQRRRRQRGQPAGARLAQRQTPLETNSVRTCTASPTTYSSMVSALPSPPARRYRVGAGRAKRPSDGHRSRLAGTWSTWALQAGSRST